MKYWLNIWTNLTPNYTICFGVIKKTIWVTVMVYTIVMLVNFLLALATSAFPMPLMLIWKRANKKSTISIKVAYPKLVPKTDKIIVTLYGFPYISCNCIKHTIWMNRLKWDYLNGIFHNTQKISCISSVNAPVTVDDFVERTTVHFFFKHCKFFFYFLNKTIDFTEVWMGVMVRVENGLF